MNFNKDYLFGDKEIKAMKLGSMNPKYIAIHNTYNTAPAINEAKNQFNNNTKKGDRGVAVHFFIDEKETYQLLPLNIHGWHAGDGDGIGNMQSIAIEICRSRDYETDNYAKAELRAVELVKYLMKQFNIPIANVRRHYDFATNKKKCPHRMFENNPRSWEQFKALVLDEKPIDKPIDKPSNETKSYVIPKGAYKENGRFTNLFTKDKQSIEMRKYIPNTNGANNGWLKHGDYVDYQDVYWGNGHVWVGNGVTWIPTASLKSDGTVNYEWGTWLPIPVSTPPPTNPVKKPDQILHVGEKFKFNEVYKVEGMKVFSNKWAVYNKKLKAYITVGIVNKTDSKGNKTVNQVLHNGDYFVVPGTFIVEKVVGNTIYPKGWGFGVDATTLLEV